MPRAITRRRQTLTARVASHSPAVHLASASHSADAPARSSAALSSRPRGRGSRKRHPRDHERASRAAHPGPRPDQQEPAPAADKAPRRRRRRFDKWPRNDRRGEIKWAPRASRRRDGCRAVSRDQTGGHSSPPPVADGGCESSYRLDDDKQPTIHPHPAAPPAHVPVIRVPA